MAGTRESAMQSLLERIRSRMNQYSGEKGRLRDQVRLEQRGRMGRYAEGASMPNIRRSAKDATYQPHRLGAWLQGEVPQERLMPMQGPGWTEEQIPREIAWPEKWQPPAIQGPEATLEQITRDPRGGGGQTDLRELKDLLDTAIGEERGRGAPLGNDEWQKLIDLGLVPPTMEI